MITQTLPEWLDRTRWKTPRWKTAIARRALSMPLRLALQKGFLLPQHATFDFGCGRGDDVKYLRDRNISCVGFDPYWRNDTSKIRISDIVSCIYVLNTIEDSSERIQVLKFAWELARRSLILAVRTDGKGEGTTSSGTFQKYYSSEEFQQFIADSLGKVEMLSLRSGVVVVRR